MLAPIPLIHVEDKGLDAAGLTPLQRGFAEAAGFTGQRGRLLPVPNAEGGLAAMLFGVGPVADRPAMVTGLAAAALPPGRYALAGAFGDPALAAIGFRLGAYRFETYRTAPHPAPELESPEGVDGAEIDRMVEGAIIARDLINTAPNDLGPAALHAHVEAFASARGMRFSAIVGDELLAQNFPMIHAVGRAGAEPPRLLDLAWGDPADPKVTLVGKGVTFDTGGLDIKPPSGMLIMKKDMGGAANILGLAHAIVDAELPVRLRVLLPVVENAISASAFRPGDVLRSRAGVTVEIGNTDAEGRLILADAIALALEEDPDLLIDMATLTGAARVALGPELPPLYASDEALAREMVEAGLAWDDPLWPMPLWLPYRQMLSSKIADINNAGSGSFAGSITAALFLRRFAEKARAWLHLDIYGWAPEARAGRPFGGTDQGIRAGYGLLKARYGRR
ncbi:leucyl aminopeptidase family protein [Devosia enhydra]|nr:leucyl aminopeptidase family protein [Devosia enhydra]